MKTNRNHIKIVLFLLTLFIISCLTGQTFGQTKKDDGEEAKKVEDTRLTKEAQAAFLAAQDAITNNDFLTAEKALNDYLATNPEYKPDILYLMLGMVYYNENKLDEATKTFKAGHEAYPDNQNMLINYATVSYENEKFVDAGKLFEKIYNNFPEKDVGYLTKAAACYYTGENLTEAKRVFLQIYNLSSEPNFEILETVYSLCVELEQNDEARKYLQVMMNLKPDKNEYWRILANTYYQDEDYINTASALEIAYAIDSPERKDLRQLQDLYAYLNVPLRLSKNIVKYTDKKSLEDSEITRVINGYLNTNRTDKAIAFIDEINKIKANDSLLLRKSKILQEARKNKEAIAAADDCLSNNPKNAEAYIIKGYAAWDMEDWETARTAFEKASEFKDYKELAKNYLGVIESLDNAKAELINAREEAMAKEETTAFSPAE